MKKRLGGILAAVCLLLTGCGGSQPVEFRRMTFREQGMAALTYEVEALRTENGVEISIYDGNWNYAGDVSRGDCLTQRRTGDQALYQEIAQLAGACRIRKWDGFRKSSRHVLDGKMYGFDAELADGETVRATGSNRVPDHYRELRDALVQMVQEQPDVLPETAAETGM